MAFIIHWLGTSYSWKKRPRYTLLLWVLTYPSSFSASGNWPQRHALSESIWLPFQGQAGVPLWDTVLTVRPSRVRCFAKPLTAAEARQEDVPPSQRQWEVAGSALQAVNAVACALCSWAKTSSVNVSGAPELPWNSLTLNNSLLWLTLHLVDTSLLFCGVKYTQLKFGVKC